MVNNITPGLSILLRILLQMRQKSCKKYHDKEPISEVGESEWDGREPV